MIKSPASRLGLRRLLGAAMLATAGVGLVTTLLLCVAWGRSFQAGDVVTRTRWIQDATTDEWWVHEATIGGGVLTVSLQHRTSPAFVGNFVVGDAAFSNNRTEPIGEQWSRRQISRTRKSRNRADEPDWARRLGIGWSSWTISPAAPYREELHIARLHLWLPVLLSATATSLLVYLARRTTRPIRRARAGLCPWCGYDLRGTPERCPECGATTGDVIARAAIRTAGP